MFAGLLAIAGLAALWTDLGPTVVVRADDGGSSSPADCPADLMKQAAAVVSCPVMQKSSKTFPTCKCGSYGSISRLEVNFNGKVSSLSLCNNCSGVEIPVPYPQCCTFVSKSFPAYFGTFLNASCKGITMYTCATAEAAAGSVEPVVVPVITAAPTLPPPPPAATIDDWMSF